MLFAVVAGVFDIVRGYYCGEEAILRVRLVAQWRRTSTQWRGISSIAVTTAVVEATVVTAAPVQAVVGILRARLRPAHHLFRR